MINNGEKGFTLIENIIAVAIVGLISVAFLSALATAYKSDFIANQLTNAGSLARSQTEYIKSQSYSPNSWQYTVSPSSRVSTSMPSWWDVNNPPLLTSGYAGFSVTANVTDFDSNGNGTIEVPGRDEGVRKIIVRVYHDGNSQPVITLEDYKVKR